MEQRDYLIVGQGIAGSLLAYELMKRDQRVMVVNQTWTQSASRVAAGLYNPITGRKMVKTWNCDKLFPVIESYYENLENDLQEKFLEKTGIYRPFLSIEEQNDWQGKAADSGFKEYVSQVVLTSTEDALVNDIYGGLMLQKAGFVRLGKMLDAFRNFFTHKGSYQEGLFDLGTSINNEGIIYQDCKYRRVVFCEGEKSRRNKLFEWLPFRPVKGETLDLEINYSREQILNRGVFLMPLGNSHFRLGATYNNHDLSYETTEQARMELLEKLGAIFKGQFDIKGQNAGIRPATKDRRPIIGNHPTVDRVYISNGFGAKGVSLAPYYSCQFADHLCFNSGLDKEVNINRFFSLF